MYVSSISINIPVEGNMTASTTFVGNNKIWVYGSGAGGAGPATGYYPTSFGANIDQTGVRRRYNFNPTGSILPRSVAGVRPIAANGTLPASGQSATGEDGGYLPRIQSIQISTDFGRPEIFQLGKRAPYCRYIDFPVEITTAIEIIDRGGDKVAALDTQANVSNEPIIIALDDNTLFDLGLKNKLTSISNTGGDTGKGNRTTTYNYVNYNSLYIRDPKDLSATNPSPKDQRLSTGSQTAGVAGTFSGPPT